MQETKTDLLNDLGLNGDYNDGKLEMLVNGDSKYIRDLRMNLKSMYKTKTLSEKEVALLALSISVNNKNADLSASFENRARAAGATDAEIAETMACASLLAGNNVLYRFRHFVGKESYSAMRAGLRMNIMMTPVLGKDFFELMSLAVSAVNGCEMCVRSHEASVLEAGGSEARIWDAVRIASIVSSADRLI